MKRHLLSFWKRRKPLRRSVVRTPLVLESLESRELFSVNVLSYEGYGNGSAGVNSSETQLTPANVSSGNFGKLFNAPLDGQVYAQPLVDTGVTISKGPYTTPGLAGVHNVVFVATENDTLYAIDADPSSNGQILWQRSFLNVNDPNDALPGATSVTAIPAGDVSSVNLTPEIGITSTPVIDPSTNILYLITATKQMVDGTAHYVQQLHAINISDGTDAATPYLIGDTSNGNDNNTQIYVYDNGIGAGTVTDPYNGTGKPVVQFNAMWSFDRAALSLVNGSVYAAFGSHDNSGLYHGWVVSWNIANLSTSGFQLTGVLNDDPNNGDDGIWQAGAPLAFTSDGSAFFVGVGNGDLNTPPDIGANGFPSDGNYAESILKVAPDPSITEQNMSLNGWGFQIVDYFMPYNVMQLNDNDKDISGGPVVLPASAGIPGHPNLVVAGSKDGKLYLLDGDDMGEYDPNNDDVLSSVPNGSGNNTPPVEFSGVVSTPAYFNGQLYVVGAYSDYLKAFTINSDGTLSMVSNSSDTFGFEPGSPAISADGTSNGILWITNRATNELQAYDPNNLGDELWSSGQGANALGSVTKFAPPVVVNGEVFVATANGLVAYGLNTPTAVSQAPSLSATVLSGTSVNLSWQDSSQRPNIASAYSIEESTDGVHFTQVTTAAQGATSLTLGGLTPGTNYWFRIDGLNDVGNSPYSNVVTATPTAVLGFSGSFASLSGQLTYNGSATLNVSSAQLTDGGSNEAGSVFTNIPLDITAFQTQFTFQLSAGGNTGDGFTFTIQNVGPTALGSNGGGLGYGLGGSGGIPQSVAIKFDLYNTAGEGNDSTGLYTDGASPTVPAIDLSGSGINFHSGDVFQVNMSYDGTTLTVVITDTNTGASATQNYTIDIPGTVGGDTAYVGFTGGTGGNTATQDIRSWTFSSAGVQAPATPTGLSAVPSSGSSVLLSWTNGSVNQTGYYLDRATDPGFTQNLVTEALPGGPNSFTDTAVGLTPGGTYYYRLRAVNSAGSSVNTAAISVTIPLPPPTPSNAVITGVTSNAIALSWTDNAGSLATGYQIWRSANGGPFLLVATLPAGSTSWRDTSVLPGTSYEYSVVAYNVSGSKGAAEAGATTSPAPPTNSTAAVTNELASLLPSLFQLELDAVLLRTYLRLASSRNGLGESPAVLKTEILGLWSAIGSNPLMKTPLGLYALEEGFALG